MRAEVSPVLNVKRLPGPCRGSSGFGPKQFSISPLRVRTSKSAAGSPAKSSLMSPLTDSPSICASADAASVAEMAPETVLKRARDTVPRVKFASPLTVLASISALPPVSTMLPLIDFASILFAAIAVK